MRWPTAVLVLDENRPAKMTSKLNSELVAKAVDDIVAYASGETIKKGDAEVVGKKRKFTESIELQVSGQVELMAGFPRRTLVELIGVEERARTQASRRCEHETDLSLRSLIPMLRSLLRLP